MSTARIRWSIGIAASAGLLGLSALGAPAASAAPFSTTTTVTSSGISWPGAPVTYTATSPGADGGTVAFTDNGTTIAGCGAQPVDPNSYQATCSVTYASTGTHAIVATYSGDAAFNPSTSATFTESIATFATTTTLTSTDTTWFPSEPLTYTATVSGANGGAVAFTDNGVTLAGCGAQPVDPSSYQATCTFTYAIPGSEAIVATYSGDADFSPSTSATLTEDIITFATTTTVTSTNSIWWPGTPLTYTATVSGVDGTVAFTDNGTTIAGCAAQPVSSSGQATCITVPLTAGAHNITAVFSGTAAATGSTSATVTQVATSAVCAQLAGCNLSGLNLTGAQLAGASLLNANLTGINLTGADLAGANLARASLNKANLTGADLSGVTVTGANFNKVTWSGTTCPDSTSSSSDGGTCAGHL